MMGVNDALRAEKPGVYQKGRQGVREMLDINGNEI
jgi:hypothetical protein